MKRLALLVLFALSLTASAQKDFFVGGTAGIGYSHKFFLDLIPHFGYEFDDKWAVGAGLGFGIVSSDGDTECLGYAMPFGRYNVWNNGKLYFDAKAVINMAFGKKMHNVDIGLTPSLRYKFTPEWEVSGDFGLFGANYNGVDWSPAFGVSATSVMLNISYCF